MHRFHTVHGRTALRAEWSAFAICMGLLLPWITPCYAADPKAETKTPEDAGSDASPAGAGVICQSDVSFTWKPTPPKPTSEGKGSKITQTEATAPITVFHAKAIVEGSSEADGQAKLTADLVSKKGEALDSCREQHEDRARCVSTRLRVQSRDYAVLDYRSRAALQDAIKADCEHAAGVCTEASAGEITCVSKPVPETATSAASTDAEKKDPKKKK